MVKYAGGALLPRIAIDRGEKTTITVQLTAALRELILSGQLAPGQRLPSSRTLASDQGVSRTTATVVYDQLTAEGLVRSRVGSGAFVSDDITLPPPAAPEPVARAAAPRLARLGAEASRRYHPRLTHPDAPRAFITGTSAHESFPMSVWAKLSARHWRQPRHRVMGFPDASGLMELRRAICSHLRANRALLCLPEEVFIFNGAQDAFNRIGGMLLDPGDRVWFENPGAIGARNSLISSGAELVPVPVDGEGLDVAAGLEAAPDFRMAFVTPAHQHPLGVTMSLRRRAALLEAAGEAGAWVVEDDYVGEFHYAQRQLPLLRSVDTEGRVIYVGTFSKAMFGSLRLGYAVVPSELAPLFRHIAEATMQGVPSSLQAVMADFIDEGYFAAHIRRMRGIYAERRDALIAEAEDRCHDLLRVRPTDTGFHTIAELAPGLDEDDVCRRAAEAGIFLSPIGRFAIEPVRQRGVVLGFSATPPGEIAAGMQVLADVLTDAARARAREAGVARRVPGKSAGTSATSDGTVPRAIG